MTPRRDKLIKFWEKYERHFAAISLVVGFTFDLIVAKRPDSVVDNVLLLLYLFICGTIIILLNLRTARKVETQNPAEPLLLILILQFCFGGLASNLLILYGKSGTFGANAFFIGLLACFVLGNEFLKSRYAQLRFHIAVYYVLLLTYVTIAVPTFLVHMIGTRVFVLSDLMSLIAMALFLAILFSRVFRGDKMRQLYEASAIVLAIFLVFNGLYFLNIIPPVPLSLKEAGIYHSLARDAAGDYSGTYEPPPWYAFWRDTSATFTAVPGQSAYCFSAVFAPGNLEAPIVHRWEEYDAVTHSWNTRSVVSFPINGGRAGGYRGFSVKDSLAPGQWRCNIETGRGQLIGRVSFNVVSGSSTEPFTTTTL